jgi:hypothetical protein
MKFIGLRKEEREKVEDFKKFLEHAKVNDIYPVFAYLKWEEKECATYASRLLSELFEIKQKSLESICKTKNECTKKVFFKHLNFLLDYMIVYDDEERYKELFYEQHPDLISPFFCPEKDGEDLPFIVKQQ